MHCHAGYGRTGLVIASILVMMSNLPALQAVALVREKRPGSVQTDAQVMPMQIKRSRAFRQKGDRCVSESGSTCAYRQMRQKKQE